MTDFSFNLKVGDVNICFTPSTFSSNISVSGGGYDNKKNWSDVTAIFSSFNGTLRVSLAEKKISLEPKDDAAKIASRDINDEIVPNTFSNNSPFENSDTRDKPDIILSDVTYERFEQSDMSFKTPDSIPHSNESSPSICLDDLLITWKCPHVSCKELLTILRGDPQFASVPDQYGKLPLHNIAENKILFEFSQREELNYVVQKLYRAYPDAIKTRDNDGRFPFTNAIADWASGCRCPPTPNAEGPADACVSRRSFRNRVLGTFFIDPIVEWCFSRISMLVEDLKELPTSSLSSTVFSETIVEVVDNLESIPNILKIMLLIDDEDSLENIYDMGLFRRLCLRRTSLETMLVPMLKGDSKTASRAIDYLELISDPSYTKFFGLKRNPNNADIARFFRKQQAQFEAISDIDELIKCLSFLHSDEAERATATQVVRRIMDAEMGKRDMSVKVFLELIIHTLYLFSFRTAIMTSVSPGVLSISTITIVCGLYFSIRDIIVGVYTISSCKEMIHFLYDFWHFTDVLSDILPIITIFTIFINEKLSPDLGALTLGLLWLKCIGFLKTINKQFATFIFTVGKIAQDIKYFLIVMFLTIMMFSDMEYVMSKDYCIKSDCPNIESSPLLFYNILMGDTLSMDQFQDEHQKPILVIMIYVIFTIVGVIVMLNVLIAIVSASYETSVSSSQGHLGRGRMISIVSKLAVDSACDNVKDKIKEIGGRWEQFAKIVLSFEMFIVLFSVFMNVIICVQSDFPSQAIKAVFFLSGIFLTFGTIIALGPIFVWITKNLFDKGSEELWDIPTLWISENIMGIHPEDNDLQLIKKSSVERLGQTAYLEKVINLHSFAAENHITRNIKLLEEKMLDAISDGNKRTLNGK